jgi:DNA repair photolyase
MRVEVDPVRPSSILTRATGYLRSVASHSLQPYHGCTFGRSLCGVGCYVQHSPFIAGGRKWGSFLGVKLNAPERYREQYEGEMRWARRERGSFSIFMSSATDPFLPHETRYGVTRSVLEEMRTRPPDELILQTHSHRVTRYLPLYLELSKRCRLRVHLSIEGDRDRIPGLPPPASSVSNRLEAARRLKAAGLRTVVTVSPLLPIAEPAAFFRTVAARADAVVIDHFIEGDGSKLGERTLKTPLPQAMERLASGTTRLDYRDEIVEVARAIMPGRVGVGIDGFAGRFLTRSP